MFFLNVSVCSPVGSNLACNSAHIFGFFSMRCEMTFLVAFRSASEHPMQADFSVFGIVTFSSRPSLVHGP